MSSNSFDNESLKKAFQTSRLTFRAMEDNEEDRAFVHEAIQMDPTNLAQSDISVLRPQAKKSTNEMLDVILKTILPVMICLPSDQPDSLSQADQQQLENLREQKAKDSKVKIPKLIPIGFVCLKDQGTSTSRQHRSTTLGIAITEAYQGAGYGTEAINWTIDWAFRHGNFHRVDLLCLEYNVRAQRLYQKVGFVLEGRQREAVWFDRQWYDILSYSMLEQEWEALRASDR